MEDDWSLSGFRLCNCKPLSTCACTMCRKRTTLVSQVFTLLGAGCSAACVAASSPELLMVGRVLVGINSGQFPLKLARFCPSRAPCRQL